MLCCRISSRRGFSLVFIAQTPALRLAVGSLLAVLLCVPGMAQGQPDALDFQGRSSLAFGSGARALGMAGAFLARADDATAASWNPAGLSYLRRPEVSIVGKWEEFDITRRSVTGDPTESIDEHRTGTTPDFLALTYPLDLGRVVGAAQISFQRAVSFQNSRDILRGGAPIRLESEGGFDVLALGTGLQLSRKLRLGATLNRWTNGFSQVFARSGLLPTVERTDFSLEGWNVNLGLIATPIENLNLGLVAKTGFTAEVRQRIARFDAGDPTGPPQNAFDSGVPGYPQMEIDFPGAIGVGASWQPSSPLTLSVDYTRTFWSEGKIRNFFQLPFLGPPEVPGRNHFPELPYPTLTDDDQQDTEQLRLGLEYVALRGDRVVWPLRVGYFTDRQHFRSADGSAPRFNGVAAGTGVAVGPMLLDVAYTYEFGDYLDIDQSGSRIKVRAQQFYVSVIYRHR